MTRQQRVCKIMKMRRELATRVKRKRKRSDTRKRLVLLMAEQLRSEHRADKRKAAA